MAYQPATAFAMTTPLFEYLMALRALSPYAADVAGIELIWPQTFLQACFGVTAILGSGKQVRVCSRGVSGVGRGFDATNKASKGCA